MFCKTSNYSACPNLFQGFWITKNETKRHIQTKLWGLDVRSRYIQVTFQQIHLKTDDFVAQDKFQRMSHVSSTLIDDLISRAMTALNLEATSRGLLQRPWRETVSGQMQKWCVGNAFSALLLYVVTVVSARATQTDRLVMSGHANLSTLKRKNK